ncbi:hypothetical protein BAD_0876 [Bifidobacterium adolescentis ATCC 15703]|uniref:Uncharacterized protein n=1 Tax=Bifidobacterium adolescentis (strain ATCC 15703 / DSM 20083 / NCTC 11814 / E194a) TaxID=367928 RepID=A1A1S4_BIFAA|nr:hypothetical protein BAD_0876 [Bifidobacterium adolescentis ATCC 15703]
MLYSLRLGCSQPMPFLPYPGISAFLTARVARPFVRADRLFFQLGFLIPYFISTPFPSYAVSIPLSTRAVACKGFPASGRTRPAEDRRTASIPPRHTAVGNPSPAFSCRSRSTATCGTRTRCPASAYLRPTCARTGRTGRSRRPSPCRVPRPRCCRPVSRSARTRTWTRRFRRVRW